MSVITGIADALPGPHRRAAEQFAALLEGRRPSATPAPGDSDDLAALAALARGLAPSAHAPSPQFRSALRERLVAEAATRTPTVPAPRRRASEDVAAPGRPRLRSAVATVVLAAVVSGAGAAAASTRALPGDVLYGLKRQIESVQLALAGSDLDRGREHLQQADERLQEVETLAASSTAGEPGTRRTIAATLAEMERATDAGVAELTASYAETAEPEPMELLSRFAVDQRERLDDLMSLLAPSLRDEVQARIAALDRIAAQTRALLGTASPAAAGSTAPVSLSALDGWAVSRLSDQPRSASVTGTPVAGATSATGSGDSGGALLGAVEDLTGSSAPASPRASPGLGGGNTSVPPVGTVTSPPPTLTPLPTATPLPTVEPTSVTSPLPSVPCVPVPPLTSC